MSENDAAEIVATASGNRRARESVDFSSEIDIMTSVRSAARLTGETNFDWRALSAASPHHRGRKLLNMASDKRVKRR